MHLHVCEKHEHTCIAQIACKVQVYVYDIGIIFTR